MLFNSLEFILFFVLVYGLYLVLSHRVQNLMLLVASYIFYGWWDWRFLSLIALSTLVDYVCGLKIEGAKSQRTRRWWLMASMVSNLGMLGFFKYFNFFVQNLDRVLGPLGLSMDLTIASIVLPVGISFYTFQTMSYTIDIYRGELKPTRDFLNFALFVSFFPQLVAGPIERAKALLPQIETPRVVKYSQVRQGLRFILYGYIMKLVVAENMAIYTGPYFNDPGSYQGVNVLLIMYAAAYQIYGDFAGYSLIARGLSKMMGIELMRNFHQPYFATSPSDFWRRWHISLSTWLRDYLYIPLGGNRGGQVAMYRNLMLTMLLGGLWHGAALNFVFWGLFHGTILIVYRLLAKPMESFWKALKLPTWVIHYGAIIFFFHLTCLGWLLFFAKRMQHVKVALRNLLDVSAPVDHSLLLTVFLFGGLTILIDLMREAISTEERSVFQSRGMRLVTYCLGVAILILCGVFRSSEFIYFQF